MGSICCSKAQPKKFKGSTWTIIDQVRLRLTWRVTVQLIEFSLTSLTITIHPARTQLIQEHRDNTVVGYHSFIPLPMFRPLIGSSPCRCGQSSLLHVHVHAIEENKGHLFFRLEILISKQQPPLLASNPNKKGLIDLDCSSWVRDMAACLRMRVFESLT